MYIILVAREVDFLIVREKVDGFYTAVTSVVPFQQKTALGQWGSGAAKHCSEAGDLGSKVANMRPNKQDIL